MSTNESLALKTGYFLDASKLTVRHDLNPIGSQVSLVPQVPLLFDLPVSVELIQGFVVVLCRLKCFDLV